MKERNSNVELLRIFSIIGVIVLHFNNKSIGGALDLVEINSIKYFLLSIMESIFVIAVDVFMIISGFFLINSNKRNLWKAIELVFQVVIFKVGRYLISATLKSHITLSGLLSSILPTNYFVILYITVFVLSPFINILIHSLNGKNKKLFLIIILIAFSVYPTLVDLLSEIVGHEIIGLSSIGMYGSQWGYSIVNFVVCYIIGGYVYIYKDYLFSIKTIKLIVVFIINLIIILVWSHINEYIGFYTEKSALEYCNPIVILNSIIVFILFNKLQISSNLINSLAKSTFTVFLVHNIFLRKIIVKKIVSFNPIIMIFSIFAYAIFIYMICFVIYRIYILLKKLIFSKLEEKHSLYIDI